MNEFQIRPAKAADEAAILDVAAAEMLAHEASDERLELHPGAKDRYTVYLRERMKDFDAAVLIAEDDTGILGLVVGSIRKPESLFDSGRYGYVSDLMVRPEARRRGIARGLYGRLLGWFRELNVETVRLHVAHSSREARSFWESLGASAYMSELWIDIGGGGAVSTGDSRDEATPSTERPNSSGEGATPKVAPPRPVSDPPVQPKTPEGTSEPPKPPRPQGSGPGVLDLIDGGF